MMVDPWIQGHSISTFGSNLHWIIGGEGLEDKWNSVNYKAKSTHVMMFYLTFLSF
jgi:hypothetical protein